MNPTLQIVTAVHNEENNISQTLTELYKVFQTNNIPVELIICEDGSTDKTVKEIEKTKAYVPLKLITGSQRKGYSKAVLDGLSFASAPYIAFVDSDAQYLPDDLFKLYQNRYQAQYIMGFRHPRRDPLIRKFISYLFKLAYKVFTSNRYQDPSSSCLIIEMSALKRILAQPIGLLPQGFWWEFNAYANKLKIKHLELPLTHLPRPAGHSDIYSFKKTPLIALNHLSKLVQLRHNLKKISS